MNKRQKTYRICIVLMVTTIFVGIISLLFIDLNIVPKGKTEAQISIPVLSKNESRALRRYNNNYHLELAQTKGLKKPLVSKSKYKINAKKFGLRYQLYKITDNKYYEISHLSHSLPYLQAPAVEFLDLLGEEFCDQLEELKIRKYRFSVTSILRTLEAQKQC